MSRIVEHPLNDVIHTRGSPAAARAVDQLSRRTLLVRGGAGIGSLALASLLSEQSRASVGGTAVTSPQYAPKAKHLIFLFMAGAPSQMDLFDYKPKLNAFHGKTADRALLGDERFSQLRPRNKGKPSKLLGSPYKFAQHGESGHWCPNCCRTLRGSRTISRF